MSSEYVHNNQRVTLYGLSNHHANDSSDGPHPQRSALPHHPLPLGPHSRAEVAAAWL